MYISSTATVKVKTKTRSKGKWTFFFYFSARTNISCVVFLILIEDEFVSPSLCCFSGLPRTLIWLAKKEHIGFVPFSGNVEFVHTF